MSFLSTKCIILFSWKIKNQSTKGFKRIQLLFFCCFCWKLSVCCWQFNLSTWLTWCWREWGMYLLSRCFQGMLNLFMSIIIVICLDFLYTKGNRKRRSDSTKKDKIWSLTLVISRLTFVSCPVSWSLICFSWLSSKVNRLVVLIWKSLKNFNLTTFNDIHDTTQYTNWSLVQTYWLTRQT